MKTILCLLFLFIQSYAFADVSPAHARNVFMGEYKFKDLLTGSEISFVIQNNGNIELKENDTYYKAKTAINYLGNDIGPSGLSVMTMMLAGGSDEQTTTLHIRIYPHQIDRTKAELLDIVYFENDGPNAGSSASIWSKVKLLKKSQDGLFVELAKSK
jgi:hypothetical protein